MFKQTLLVLVALITLKVYAGYSDGIGCWGKEDREHRGAGYRGKQSETRKGLRCKNWLTTSYGSGKYRNEGIGDHNYCRNPAEKYKDVWCYTTSGSWDWCDVPTCGENVGCWPRADRIAKGTNYKGTQSKTKNGYTCMNWAKTSYYSAKYFDKGIGDHNYCRNPEGKYRETWCYTVNGPKYDYCSVPTCYAGKKGQE